MNVEKNTEKIVYVVVGFIVILTLIGAFAPSLIAAFNNTSTSGLPFASLFSSSGILASIFMIGIFLGLMYVAFRAMKDGSKK